MADLSPAASAVLTAFTEDNDLRDRKHLHHETDALAAALRAAAQEVLADPSRPETWLPYRRLMELADELEKVKEEQQ